MVDVANTFLHSYGSALLGCPCKCRQRPFRHTTLLQGSLRGCFVQSLVHGNPRFLREVALLCGAPNSVKYPHPLRSSLALLGLVASLMQMVWICSHLLRSVNRVLGLPSSPAPVEWLRAYQRELLKQTTELFKATSMPPLQEIKLLDQHGVELQILSPTKHSWTTSPSPTNRLLGLE